jgi:hypothetical protein
VTRTAHVPNTTLAAIDVVRALLRPLVIEEAEHEIESSFGCHAVLFASARGALTAAIHVACDGETVAIPGFTCAAVANAALSAGKRPLYVDVDERGLVPPDAWPDDALPVVQDTYGFVATDPSRPFVRDMAHRALPAGPDGAIVGVTSFEHSKSLSAGRGGLALTADPTVASGLREFRARGVGKGRRVRGSLVTLATLAMGRLDYRGRPQAAELCRKVAWHLDANRLLGQSDDELAGNGVDAALLGAPDRSASRLVVSQLGIAADVADHRRRIVGTYDRIAGIEREPVPLVRYPLLAGDVTSFDEALLQSGWDVRGRWFDAPLHPSGCNTAALGYSSGAAPTGELLASRVVNLPTHPLVEPEHAVRMMDAALEAGARPLEG